MEENQFKKFGQREIKLFYTEIIRKLNRWNFLLVDDRGKILSAQWLKKAVIGALFLLVIALVVDVSLFFCYISARTDNKKLENLIAISNEQVKALRYEKDILNSRLVLADRSQSPEPVEQESEAEEKTVESEQPDQTVSASIRDIALSYEQASATLRLEFVINNTSKNVNEISGRIFVVLKQDEFDHDKWLAIPPFNLESNQPSQIDHGKYFKISRFKTMRYTLNNQKDPERFKEATIFVFTTDGELLLERTLPVYVKIIEPAPKPQPAVQIKEKPASETVMTNQAPGRPSAGAADSPVVLPGQNKNDLSKNAPAVVPASAQVTDATKKTPAGDSPQAETSAGTEKKPDITKITGE